MNKLLMMAVLLVVSNLVIADANVGSNNQQNTFLLNAPGTLSGVKKPEIATDERSSARLPGSLPTPPQVDQTPRFNFVEEQSKFRQFGQHSGRNNPWYEDNYSRNSPRPPMQTPYMTNPWQIGGVPPPPALNQNPSANEPYRSNPRERYAPGPDRRFSGDQLYPDFPDGIYRDSNPAARSSPMNNSFMPGLGGDNFGFPFSPLDMFR